MEIVCCYASTFVRAHNVTFFRLRQSVSERYVEVNGSFVRLQVGPASCRHPLGNMPSRRIFWKLWRRLSAR